MEGAAVVGFVGPTRGLWHDFEGSEAEQIDASWPDFDARGSSLPEHFNPNTINYV